MNCANNRSQQRRKDQAIYAHCPLPSGNIETMRISERSADSPECYCINYTVLTNHYEVHEHGGDCPHRCPARNPLMTSTTTRRLTSRNVRVASWIATGDPLHFLQSALLKLVI